MTEVGHKLRYKSVLSRASYKVPLRGSLPPYPHLRMEEIAAEPYGEFQLYDTQVPTSEPVPIREGLRGGSDFSTKSTFGGIGGIGGIGEISMPDGRPMPLPTMESANATIERSSKLASMLPKSSYQVAATHKKMIVGCEKI